MNPVYSEPGETAPGLEAPRQWCASRTLVFATLALTIAALALSGLAFAGNLFPSSGLATDAVAKSEFNDAISTLTEFESETRQAVNEISVNTSRLMGFVSPTGDVVVSNGSVYVSQDVQSGSVDFVSIIRQTSDARIKSNTQSVGPLLSSFRQVPIINYSSPLFW